jgi:hypothetical protein
MLDMEEVTAALTSPISTDSPKGEADGETEYASEMDSHATMMCEVLKNQGRLEAKLDMLIDMEMEDEAEDEAEKSRATDGILALPMGSSGSGGGSSGGHLTYDGSLIGLGYDGI